MQKCKNKSNGGFSLFISIDVPSLWLGYYSVLYNLLSNENHCLSIRYSSCCWIGLVSGGGSWEVRVKGNLTRRADNGLINTSPISTMPPIVRLQHGCNHTIQIPGKADSPAKVTHISK